LVDRQGKGRGMRKLIVVSIAIVMAAVALLGAAPRASAAPVGSYVDRVVFFEQANAAVALQDVSRGTNMQLYMFNLRNLADKVAALGDPNIWTVQTPGSVNDLFINPVRYGSGTPGFNPFELQAVRRAMNYLVDRDFIINEIYGGFGIPYVSPWHSKMPEYRREAAFFGGLDQEFSYNPSKAQSEITTALLAHPGVTQVSGRFQFNGQPLTVRFVIRIEDVRLDIGNYVADQLESIGITVTRDYSPAAEAFNKVYFGPPDIAAWNLYTEGFAFTALQAWQDDWIAGFYQAYSGETIWDLYTPPAALVTQSNQLLNSQYTTLPERQNLIKSASRLAVEDGVRVWMVAENAVFIYNRRVTAAVNDLMAGPWGLYTTRSARYATDGGSLLVGQPVHWNSQWNTYRGFTWLYDATQQRALTDFGVYLSPSTGLPVPVRAQYTVTTAGPTGTMAIPAGTMIWDTTTSQFVAVPTGATAVSKVTYDYTFGQWHDGTPISMDDVWYIISNFQRRLAGTDKAINPYSTATPKAPFPDGDIGMRDPRADSPGVNFWLGLFKGARQVDADTMELYADYWHIDEGTIAFTLDIFPSLPWHVHELQVRSVLDNDARFDASSATTDSKVLIDLIRGATLPLMNADLPILNATAIKHVPAGFGSIITQAEAGARYQAMDIFRKAEVNYYISNGPFYFDTVNVAAKQSILSRFNAYPFTADKWDAFINPVQPTVTIGSIPDVVPGLAATIGIGTTLAGQPTSDVQINYLIRNVGLDRTVLAGAPVPVSTGTWQVPLSQNTTSALIPGAHEITTTVLGSQLGAPVTQTVSFIVIPSLVYFEQLLGETNAVVDGLTTDLNAANAQIQSLNSALASTNTIVYVALGLAVAGVAVAVVSVVMLARARGAMKKAAPAPEEMPPKME